MAQTNTVMVVAGILTMLQSIGQALFTTVGLLQYYCVIDFLRQRPLLLYIKILYFHNPSVCGAQINIGQTIEGLPSQAFVLLTKEPFTSTRTFLINCSSLGLSLLWLITCFGLMRGGAENKPYKAIRWPWIIVTTVIGALDLGATVTYANDSFNTKTLSEIMDLIGGTTSGTGNLVLNTQWAAWVMVILYSRLAVLFLLNILLIVLVVVNSNKNRQKELVESGMTQRSLKQEEDQNSSLSFTSFRIPRPELIVKHSYQHMKARLLPKRPVQIHAVSDRRRVARQVSHMTATTTPRPDLWPRLDATWTEQRKGWRQLVLHSPGMPQNSNHVPTTGRRGTAAELQGQLPWAYIPAPAHRMRDQLPPYEDLPPLPLPDYNALPSDRKASVHRAASGLSSLAWKRDFKYLRAPMNRSDDVLY